MPTLQSLQPWKTMYSLQRLRITGVGSGRSLASVPVSLRSPSGDSSASASSWKPWRRRPTTTDPVADDASRRRCRTCRCSYAFRNHASRVSGHWYRQPPGKVYRDCSPVPGHPGRLASHGVTWAYAWSTFCYPQSGRPDTGCPNTGHPNTGHIFLWWLLDFEITWRD